MRAGSGCSGRKTSSTPGGGSKACLMRQIRADLIGRLSGVHALSQIPFGIVADIRNAAVGLLQNPNRYGFQGLGCGGDAPDTEPAWSQQTRIGHF
jgi:hypothetical protein